jgi:hypothetical protein
MTELSNKVVDEQKERDVWPGRYYVYATAERFPYRRTIYKNVSLILHQFMKPEEVDALLEPFGFGKEDEAYQFIASQVEQTFTKEQADLLIAYLENHDGTKAWKEPATKPLEGYMGVGAIPSGVGHSHYDLHEESSYNLGFKAVAYYDLHEVKPADIDIQEIASRHGIEELRPELAEAFQRLLELPDESLLVFRDVLDALRIEEAREAILDALVPMSKE